MQIFIYFPIAVISILQLIWGGACQNFLFILFKRGQEKNQQNESTISVNAENIFDTWDNSQFARAVLIPGYPLGLLHQHHPKTLQMHTGGKRTYENASQWDYVQ